MILFAPKSNQTVELNIPENIKSIGVRVSGGADTAILFYILCKHIKESKREIKVYPIYKQCMDRPQTYDVMRVIQKVKELLDYPEFIQDLLMITIPNKSYYEYQECFNYKLFEMGIIDICYGGTTTNPKDSDFNWRSIKERINLPPRREIFDGQLPENVPKKYLEFPFGAVDKKFIAEMYDLHKVREDLLPLTWSCEGSWLDTKGFTKPCGSCYWCEEKRWAFGSADPNRENYCAILDEKLPEYWDTLQKDFHYNFDDNFKNKSWLWKLVNKIFKLQRDAK